MQYADLRSWLPDDLLVKVDRTSMAESLEVRCPYLDHRLVELAAMVPSRWKLKGLTAKWILRRVSRDLLPKAARDRRKHIFEVPIANWLRHELFTLTKQLLDPKELSQHGVFEPEIGQKLLADHVTGRGDYSRALWTMAAFQLWYRAFSDPPSVTPATRYAS
jgi:asparagine synthase (glutamine-hydrolysing)